MLTYLKLAARVAVNDDVRHYRLGAVGVRRDGAIVSSRNCSTKHPFPPGHAEARLCRKLDYGSIVYVARIFKDNKMANARPCPRCIGALVVRRVVKVYYTISEDEYGVINLGPK